MQNEPQSGCKYAVSCHGVGIISLRHTLTFGLSIYNYYYHCDVCICTEGDTVSYPKDLKRRVRSLVGTGGYRAERRLTVSKSRIPGNGQRFHFQVILLRFQMKWKLCVSLCAPLSTVCPPSAVITGPVPLLGSSRRHSCHYVSVALC